MESVPKTRSLKKNKNHSSSVTEADNKNADGLNKMKDAGGIGTSDVSKAATSPDVTQVSSGSISNDNDNDDDNRPPSGSTYLTIGQDLFSIEEYIREQYNYSLHDYTKNYMQQNHHNHHHHHHHESRHGGHLGKIPVVESFIPAAFMVYTDIQTLNGLFAPTDYGSGIEYADGLLRLVKTSSSSYAASVPSSPTATEEPDNIGRYSADHDLLNYEKNEKEGISRAGGLQIGLWLNGTDGCRDIINGDLDESLDRLFRYLLYDCWADKIFLRVGYEFDNPGFRYSDDPTSYKQAFQYVVQHCESFLMAFNSTRTGVIKIDQDCRDKISFVWHSWAAGVPGGNLDDFYPGNEFVDWVGVSLFNQLFINKNSFLKTKTVTDVMEFARNHDKPTMIAESTPFGGIDSLKDPWMDWFQPVLDLIEKYDISMWSYINCNWRQQPMWHTAGFGDTRLSINETIMELWSHRVLKKPRFLQAGSLSSSVRVQRRADWTDHIVVPPTLARMEHSMFQAIAPALAGIHGLIGILMFVVSLSLSTLYMARRHGFDSNKKTKSYAAVRDDVGDYDDPPVVGNILTGYGSLEQAK